MKTIYSVNFRKGDKWEVSRYFQTLRAARSWMKWLKKSIPADEYRIYNGGPGGMRTV